MIRYTESQIYRMTITIYPRQRNYENNLSEQAMIVKEWKVVIQTWS